MKIAIVCHPTQGGSGIVATELGLALARRGHEIHFISHSLPFRLRSKHKNVFFHEVNVTNYPLFRYPPYDIALAGKLAALSMEIDFDVLHVHYAIPHAVSAYLCHQILGKKSPPVITTLHGTDISLLGIDENFKEITRFVIAHSDAVTAVSDYLARLTLSNYDLDIDIRVIYNGIDPVRLNPEYRNKKIRARYLHRGEFLIGHMSNFRSVKRVSDVVRAFHLIQKEVPARLLFIGEGAEIDMTKHMIKELGISNKVEFTGSIEQVGEMLAQLDLFLLPSEMESFGLAALEAMASGVPVITSNAGGLPEVIEDGVSGLIYDVGDYAGMARGGVELLRDDNRRTEMCMNARKRAVNSFDGEAIVSQYESLYRELVDRTRAIKA